MGEKMASEKTPTLLYTSKESFENDEKKVKLCSKSMIVWILAVTLIALVLILSVEFLYPTFEERVQYDENHVHIVEERPLEVTVSFHKSSTTSEDKIDDEDNTPRVQDTSHHNLAERWKCFFFLQRTFDRRSPLFRIIFYIRCKKRITVNPWDFEFLIDPADLCQTRNPPTSSRYKQNPEVKLLMLVPSEVDHFGQRKAIRRTWGSIAEKSMGPFRLGFVIGTTSNKTVGDMIRKESAEYKDIIQVDIVDGFFDRTTKSVLMLKWVAKRCPHAQYFLKSDDDTFVNVGIVADILNSEPFLSTKKFIGGYVYNGLQDSKLPKEEHYAIESNLPFDQFPSFTSGSAYVMTGPTAIDLFDASKEVEPVLPMDDVFLTGICADHMGVPRLHDPRFSIDSPPSPPTWKSFGSLASVHRVTPNILEEVWNDLTRTLISQLFNLDDRFNSTTLFRKKRNL